MCNIALLIVAGNSTRDTIAELLAREIPFGLADKAADNLHGITTITAKKAITSVGLRC